MKFQNYIKCFICIFVLNLSYCRSQRRLNYPRDYLYSRRNVIKPPVTRYHEIEPSESHCKTCQCGHPNFLGTRRFLAGEYTLPHEFPWLANVHVEPKSVFTGALINDYYVITAASPIVNASISDVKVTLGGFDRCDANSSAVNFNVTKIIVHPEFNPETAAHDLALVRLDSRIMFGKMITPICLPDEMSRRNDVQLVATITGWTMGTDYDTEHRTCKPRKIILPKLSREECVQAGINETTFDNSSGCVGVMGVTSFACGDDVGSLVQHRTTELGPYHLAGIISSATICGKDTSAAMFSTIISYVDWITSETEDACYCLVHS